MSGAEWLRPAWDAPPRVRAAFTLRRGGVSAPPYDSLNVGTHVEDDPASVAENRDRVCRALALPAEPVWLDQIHGTHVVRVDAPQERMQLCGDGAVTRAAGRVCVIQVADCMPVLFAARDGSVVGAAHCGWRGLAQGVLESTVQALESAPSEVLAWLGPAIGPSHFEVGDDVLEAFVSRDAGAMAAFAPNARGRWLCDLGRLATRRLNALGIHAVSAHSGCTYADADRFFSYRRDGRCGRMAALIWLEG